MEAVVGELREGGVRAVTEAGVLGDPTRAEPGRGARDLDALAGGIAAALRRREAHGD